MLTLLQGTQTQPLPSLTYGSPISNAYIQIAKILKQATALPLPTPSRYAHEPLAQSAVVKPCAHHIAALITTLPTAGKQGSTKKLLRGPDATIWEHGLANKGGRLLSHGLGLDRSPKDRITGTGTVFFIAQSHFPPKRKVTYANFVCNIRPQKTEIHQVRMTAGGDKLGYPGDASSPTVSMMDSKLHNHTKKTIFVLCVDDFGVKYFSKSDVTTSSTPSRPSKNSQSAGPARYTAA
jgi:hypothetical protein